MNYLVKNAIGEICKLHVVSGAPQLPEGFELLGLESELNPDGIQGAIALVDGKIIQDMNKTRLDKLNAVRALRSPLLAQADILVNIALDKNVGLKAAQDYRQSLRDCTSVFDADMSQLDSLDVSAFVFPVKP